MSIFAMMFNAVSLANMKMNKAVARAAGGGGAGFRKNAMTVRTGRALLIAYAMQARAEQDIAHLSNRHT